MIFPLKDNVNPPAYIKKTIINVFRRKKHVDSMMHHMHGINFSIRSDS